MAQEKIERKKPTGRVIQIKNLDPDIIRMIDIYEAQHGNMAHAELLTKAFLALLASENEQ